MIIFIVLLIIIELNHKTLFLVLKYQILQQNILSIQK